MLNCSTGWSWGRQEKTAEGIGLSAPQLDRVCHGGTDPPRAESGGVVVRVHLARADGHSKPGRAPIQFWRRRAEVTKATRRCGRVYGVVVSALAAAPRQQ